MRIKHLLTAAMLTVAGVAMANSPKYIFYFIGDGMGMGATCAAERYYRDVLGSDQSLTMLQFPVASMAFTHSASSSVTDSSAAGTALAAGSKTKNGMLGMNSDTIPVVSIATKLKAHGWGIGLATTVAPDDATPGAFYAHVPYRGMYYEIGKQAASSGFEFIAGANLRGRKDKDGKENDLLRVFEENDVAVVRGLDGLAKTNNRKVLLLNTDTIQMNEVGLAIDSIEGVLTLPQMTEACLSHLLKNSPDHFFMMVEGGSIDHAGHANDAATSVMETINFDKSLAIAYEFYKQHPDETLIVVTADHETGGMALANKHLHYWLDLKYLQYPKMSKDMFTQWSRGMLKSRRVFTWDDMKEFLQENTGLYGGIPVSESDDQKLQEKFVKTFELRNSEEVETMYNSFNEFTEEVYKIISKTSGIGWTSNDHSGAAVPVFAVGVDADKFSAAQDNTDIPKKIYSIAGY